MYLLIHKAFNMAFATRCSLTKRLLQSHSSQMMLLTSQLWSGPAERYQATYLCICSKLMYQMQLISLQPAELVRLFSHCCIHATTPMQAYRPTCQ